MADIVERLEGYKRAAYPEDMELHETAGRAKDEIERLRADNERLRAALRQYEDEIETDLGGKDDAADRLSLAVNGHKAGARELFGGNDCLLFKQSLAHIERLRAALRAIVTDCDSYERNNNLSGTWASLETARRALEGKDD